MNENLIDRYLLNLLNTEEKELFEAQLKINESLNSEMILQKELMVKIKGLGRNKLKSELQILHKDLDLDSTKSSTMTRRLLFRLAIASIFISILSIGWWWTQNNPTCLDLYSQNFEPYELSITQRSEDSNSFNLIEKYYVSKNYRKAIPLFQDVLNEKEIKPSQFLLGLGICYLQTDLPNNAIVQFNDILVNKDFNFVDEAQWYLGLSYLKLDDAITAKLHLEALISDPKKDHYIEAKSILDQLKIDN